MSVFSVKPAGLRVQKGVLLESAEKYSRMAAELADTADRMAGAGSCENEYSPAVRNVSERMRSLSGKISALGNSLEDFASLYENTEETILSFSMENTFTASAAEDPGAFRTAGLGGSILSGAAFSGILGGLSDALSTSGNNGSDGDPILREGSWAYNRKLYEGTFGNGAKGSTRARAAYSDRNSIYEIGKDLSAADSFWQKTWKNKYGKVQAQVGQAEAKGELTAGIYQIGKDDQKVFAPCVKATVGGSVCALSVKASGQVGNDYISASAKGEGTVGRAEAKVKARAEFVDKTGKFAPGFSANASAEAVAVEAKGQASGKLLGVEGTVKAGVNVGIGAHADVGIEGGKIRCDVGASLGVGVNLGFELDVSEGVKSICKGAMSFWDWWTKVFPVKPQQ
ncbi:MAG: hypothetical protein IIY55_10545 [Blautia sp.]|nr:hypothetical protein [Blautia sp.]